MALKKKTKLKVMKNLGALAIASGVTLGGFAVAKNVNIANKQDDAYDECVKIVDKVKQSESFMDYYGDKYNTLCSSVEANLISSDEMYGALNDCLTVEHIYANREDIIDSQETQNQLEDSYLEYLKYKYKNAKAVGISGALLGIALVSGGLAALSSSKEEAQIELEQLSQ